MGGGEKEVGKEGIGKRETGKPLVETLSIYSSLIQSGYKSVVTCMWSPGMAVIVSVVSSCRSGLPVRTELKETSVIHRLWSSLMPVTIR